MATDRNIVMGNPSVRPAMWAELDKAVRFPCWNSFSLYTLLLGLSS